MALITLCTGASGFLFSYGLLRLGFERMWLRYLVALLAAYLVFFCLLRLWLRLRGRRLESPDASDFADALSEVRLPSAGGFRGGGGQFGGGGASSSLEAPRFASATLVQPAEATAPGLDLPDADEAAIPLLVVMALVGALLASLWVVYIAPGMFAELLVDTALAGGLYHRLQRDSARSWVVTALRSTALPFGITCILFVGVGWFVQSRLPEAKSIGDVVRYLQTER